MNVMMNGSASDAQITMRRNDPRPGDENLYVDDTRVTRVTHALDDEIPVILVLENDAVVEVDRQSFYAINGIDYDWQPGTQPNALAGS